MAIDIKFDKIKDPVSTGFFNVYFYFGIIWCKLKLLYKILSLFFSLLLIYSCGLRALTKKENARQPINGLMLFTESGGESFFFPDTMNRKIISPALLNKTVVYTIEKAGGMELLKSDAKKFPVRLMFIDSMKNIQYIPENFSIISCTLFYNKSNTGWLQNTGEVTYNYNGSNYSFKVFHLFEGGGINLAEKK